MTKKRRLRELRKPARTPPPSLSPRVTDLWFGIFDWAYEDEGATKNGAQQVADYNIEFVQSETHYLLKSVPSRRRSSKRPPT